MSTAQATVMSQEDASVAELETLLRELITEYERLNELAGKRQDAMRHADTRTLGEMIGAENLSVQRVADLERRRLPLVGEMAKRLAAPPKTEVTITWLAQRLSGAAGDRLAGLASRLRGLIQALLRTNEASKKTAETLATHMDGLMRQVAASLNHARTYSASGMVTAGPRVVTAIDVKS
jgi:hypothetical protein